jgi:ubiquinone/menaquinone biosynthesis C-methylase UbiE
MSRAYWEDVAARYDQLYTSQWNRWENDTVQGRLADLGVGATDQVLDIGCGTGLGLDILERFGAGLNYVGLDTSRRMISVARRKHPGATFVIGDATNLPFRPGSFDLAMSLFTSLSYACSYRDAIDEAARVVRPGGRIHLSTLNRWSLRRLFRVRVRKIERYRTRGTRSTRASFAPAWALSSGEMRSLLSRAGFTGVQAHSLSILGGIAEWPTLMRVDGFLQRLMPWAAHMLDYTATRT